MTNEQPKYLFDECALSACAVATLAQLLEFASPDSSATVQHKLKFHDHGEGIWDEVWIPEAAKEGWIVISADRGKKGGRKKGEKLPRVCRDFQVTHVLMSGGMMKRKQFDKILSILSVWYPLLDTAKEPGGTQFMMEPAALLGRAILRRKEPTIDPGEPPPPGYLFQK
ncbi:MAG: hypothetical protein HQ581_08375 [Planctomycetes bacterium]|nr:hypothetical protein [Planctomycetota bacterium]